MRFSIAAIAALAAGVVASDVVTETVTHYTTYCPEATSIVHGGSTYSISTPGHITMTNGPFTVTRPLITQTVTSCNKCSSSGVPSGSPSSTVKVTSTPLVPSSAGATGTSGTSPSGAASTSQAAFNAGAVNAATGAGAGLAAVFGAVALLL
ncbi:hypothetical protein N7462_009931 [Penicillium macrosclerotiorum]|uniref:uncharacterized protein n=1 Tax=Penicillium macrosclerotiorum TaxID=303699 RepID=UPI002549BC6C|nr:uncharacterized protein N7462_009931 [Penicillium macrosclerotiorum]KAJ5668861.1 hypothetical protein N7462_009931 [Penicillium macrosclerotiorum]